MKNPFTFGRVMTVFIISTLSLGIYSDYTDPGYSTVDVGTVVENGCTTFRNKFGTHYDCSADIEFEKSGLTRAVIKFGALNGDKVKKSCRPAHHGTKHRCMITRFDADVNRH